MIEVVNGNILIDGIATTNPELIGLAMLDSIENKKVNKDEIKKKYFDFIKLNSLRKTPEREILLDLIVDKNITNPVFLAEQAEILFITRATTYSFIRFLVNADILICQPKKYIFK